MTFNAGDLEEALEERYGDDGEFWDELAWDSQPVEVTANGEAVKVERVDTSTGTYDGDTYIIFKVGDRHFRKSGWSASHYGTEWDGSFDEVESYEKVETYWRVKR